jgi:hypothetical protein
VPVTKYPPTPELDKQAAIVASGEANTVQHFLDWLYDDQNLVLEPDPGRSREQLMADFFGIDLRKIETERRAILDAIRTNRLNTPTTERQ